MTRSNRLAALLLAVALAAAGVLGARALLWEEEQPPPLGAQDGGVAETGSGPGSGAELVARGAAGAAAVGGAAEAERVGAGTRDGERRPAASQPPAAPRGALPFRLVDDIGDPLDAALFVFHRDDPDDPERRELDGDDGAFELADLEHGSWHVAVTVEHHVPPAPARGVGSLYDVPWSAGPIELVFTRGARVEGRVVDGSGSPVRAKVRLHDLDSPGKWYGAGRTNENFVIDGVRPGRFELVAENDFLEARTELTLAAGEQREGIELRLEGGGWIQGRVLDHEGAPAAEVDVMVVDHLDIRTGTKADLEGAFRFGPVSAGTYRVTAILKDTGEEDTFRELLAREVTLAEGQVVDVLLQPAAGARVKLTGRVLHAGEPLPRCVVYAMREGVPLLDTVRMARADGEGVYELELDGGGDVLFLFEPRDNPSDSPLAPLRAWVPDAAEARLDLVVAAGAITGRVVDVEGEPVSDARVVAEPADARLDVELPDQRRGTESLHDGTFRLRYLADGLYTLRVEAHLPAWEPAWEPSEARVREGEETRVELRAQEGGVVRGTVRGPDGAPVEGAVVHVFATDGRLVRLEGAETDSDGRWIVAGVPAGRVSAGARAAGLASLVSEARELAAGGELRIDLALAAGTLLTVVARDGGGPPASADLRVIDAGGRDVTRLVAREHGANFADPLSTTRRTVGPLAPGTYTVSATAPDGRNARASVRLEGGGERVVELEL